MSLAASKVSQQADEGTRDGMVMMLRMSLWHVVVVRKGYLDE